MEEYIGGNYKVFKFLPQSGYVCNGILLNTVATHIVHSSILNCGHMTSLGICLMQESLSIHHPGYHKYSIFYLFVLNYSSATLLKNPAYSWYANLS